MRTPFLVSLGACGALLLAGCPPAPRTGGIYFGPTSKMVEVVRDVNANNSGITTVWTDHTFRAWIHDDKHKEHYVDGDGVLLYRKTAGKPDELLLQGTSIIGKIFEIGSSSGPDAQYWVAVVPEIATEWWGYYKNLGKPCSKPIPIHPDLVTEVLGVNEIDENFLSPPIPAMRFNNDADVYMFTFSVPMTTRWVIQKEVWYARKTKLPVKVLLFDPDGRILLRADLSEHQPLEGGEGRMIATRYKLFFPETRDQLEFSLKSPKLTKKGLPREGTIKRRPIGDVKEIRIDEDCGD
jgi:hypothetical protein